MGRQFIIFLAALRILGWDTPFLWFAGVCAVTLLVAVVIIGITHLWRRLTGHRPQPLVS